MFKISLLLNSSDRSVRINDAFDVSPPSVWVSDEARRLFQWVVYAVLLVIVSIFGTVTNIINIICFVKQGLKDPINVSLLGLAISDLGSLVTLFGTSIFLNPALQESDVPFDSVELQYLTSVWPHVMFTRVTSWMTALITLERCLCITMPLKVKMIITPKRVTVIIVVVFIILIGSVSPMYYANRYAMVFSPDRNRTILRLVYTDDRAVVEQISFAINNVFIPFTAYITVITCTVVLVVNLRKKAKWRLKCTAPANMESTAERDQKVSKMVVVISMIFIASLIPLCFTFIAMLIEPELAVAGRYKNTLYILGGLSLLLESANSASNIFVYYNMSSRYRTTFQQVIMRRHCK